MLDWVGIPLQVSKYRLLGRILFQPQHPEFGGDDGPARRNSEKLLCEGDVDNGMKMPQHRYKLSKFGMASRSD